MKRGERLSPGGESGSLIQKGKEHPKGGVGPCPMCAVGHPGAAVGCWLRERRELSISLHSSSTSSVRSTGSHGAAIGSWW